MNKNTNDREYLVQKIRTQYTAPIHTELDALRELDKKVKTPPLVTAYTLGSIAALVMGAGMSLIMTDIGATIGVSTPLVPGLVLGVVGLLAAIGNYPLYKRLLNRRRKTYAPQILALSDKLMKE